MEQIKIKCATGFNLSVNDLSVYKLKLKKHSMLEIMRIEESIKKDGFLFPITVGKIGDKNYIIDGEATYYALCELINDGFDIPEIPVVYVKCNEDTIKKMILIGTSTNHCVTKSSLEQFCDDEKLLKDLAFNEGTLIDFYTKSYFVEMFAKYKTQKSNNLKCDKFFDDVIEGLI